MAFLDFIRNRQAQEASAPKKHKDETGNREGSSKRPEAKEPESKSNLQSQLSPAHQRDLADRRRCKKACRRDNRPPLKRRTAGRRRRPRRAAAESKGPGEGCTCAESHDGHRGSTQAETKGRSVTGTCGKLLRNPRRRRMRNRRRCRVRVLRGSVKTRRGIGGSRVQPCRRFAGFRLRIRGSSSVPAFPEGVQTDPAGGACVR